MGYPKRKVDLYVILGDDLSRAVSLVDSNNQGINLSGFTIKWYYTFPHSNTDEEMTEAWTVENGKLEIDVANRLVKLNVPYYETENFTLGAHKLMLIEPEVRTLLYGFIIPVNILPDVPASEFVEES